MINLIYLNENDKISFINEGELVDEVVITKSFNILSDKIIDLRRHNSDIKIYINLGDESVTPEEINTLYNGLLD